jgi:phenylacetate-CoA ligase
MQWHPHERLREYQASQLLRILSHAQATSPYYAARIPKLAGTTDVTAALASLPLLEKRDLQQHADDIRSRASMGRLSQKTTGGSTGEPVTILKDRTATAYERAAMWLAYGWFGVEMGDRAARFWGTPYTWKRRLTSRIGDLCMNRIRFSAFEFDDDRLGHYWQRLRRFEPDYVHGYVSMLEQMARWSLREGDVDPPRLKSVIATSEVLTPPQRAVIEEAFRAPVQVEYGCGEVGPIAHQCPEGSLHIMIPNLWVEVLRPDGTGAQRGESGELVLTDLHNRAMPLVRYRVGDFGVLGGFCTCGRSLPVLDKVWGRAYDFVEAPDGRRYHGEFFMYVFEDLRSSGVAVGQFQVIQRAPGELEILVTSDGGAPSATSEAIVGTLGRRLPGMDIRVQHVPQIPRADSGKMQVIQGRRPETGATA